MSIQYETNPSPTGFAGGAWGPPVVASDGNTYIGHITNGEIDFVMMVHKPQPQPGRIPGTRPQEHQDD